MWTDDRQECLAYSESSHTYLDTGAAPVLHAIGDAAREADWSTRATGVSCLTPETMSWMRGAVLVQWLRTATREEQLLGRVAEEHGLNKTTQRVVQIAAATRRPERMDALLQTWAPIIGRSTPQRPFILGDDIVLFGLPSGASAAEDAQQGVPFMGIPVDQHTLIGFTEPGGITESWV